MAAGMIGGPAAPFEALWVALFESDETVESVELSDDSVERVWRISDFLLCIKLLTSGLDRGPRRKEKAHRV